jgi:hypothetical protein
MLATKMEILESGSGHRTGDVSTAHSAGATSGSSNFISMDDEAGAGDTVGYTVGAETTATNAGRSSFDCSNIGDSTTSAGGDTIGAASMADNSDAAGEPTSAMAGACTSMGYCCSLLIICRSMWSAGSVSITATILSIAARSSSIVDGFLFFLSAMVTCEGWVGWDLQHGQRRQ